jgi:hypothetical protein
MLPLSPGGHLYSKDIKTWKWQTVVARRFAMVDWWDPEPDVFSDHLPEEHNAGEGRSPANFVAIDDPRIHDRSRSNGIGI